MLFSLFDNKSECFGPLFQSETDESAKRIFAQTYLSGKDTMLSMYIEDFSLYRLGDYDNLTGHILCEPSPYLVQTGFELKVGLTSLKSAGLREDLKEDAKSEALA